MILRSVLSLLLKDVLRRQDSQAVASLNATVCAVVLALWAGLSGGPMAPQAAGWPVAVLLVVSGVVGIWAGVALNNWLVSGLGLVRMQLSTCAVPPVVAVVGWLILGEAVGLGQLACGGLILGCVVYLMWLKHESASASAEVSEPVVFDQPKAAIGPVVKDHADSRATCSHH
jgi:drug/metabolite transporter (DMT)-like permease